MDCTDRKISCQILANLFSYPEQGLLDNLPLILEELAELFDLTIPAELKAAQQLTELEVAYTGLFINRLGGAPAPPYGSVYLETAAKLMGESNQRVTECYLKEGLNLDASCEPADFLATELEFLFYLAECEETATATSAADSARQWRAKQDDFCRELLFPWLPEFCRRIDDSNGGHPLYSFAAEALKAFHKHAEKDLPTAPAEMS